MDESNRITITRIQLEQVVEIGKIKDELSNMHKEVSEHVEKSREMKFKRTTREQILCNRVLHLEIMFWYDALKAKGTSSIYDGWDRGT